MSRRCIVALSHILLTAGVLLTGCQPHEVDYDLARAAVARQKVQEIETLELDEAPPEDEEEAPPEPNEPLPEALELSLPECRALALENNLQLKAQLIAPSIAAAQLSEEEAKFESVFYADVDYLKAEQPFGSVVRIPDSSVFLPVVESSQRERITSNLGVQMPLRTGGNLTFNAADIRNEDPDGDPNVNPSYEDRFSVSLSQPLLRNAGQWVNTYSIRVAAYNRDLVSAQTKLEVITVLAALDRVYWRLYAARRELEVREQQYELAQAQLERAQRLVDAGERAQVEVIRAEAGVAQQLEAIIVAENNLRDRERELKRLVNRTGLDMESATVIALTSEPDPVRYDLEPSRLIRLAMDSRMELLQLQFQILQDATGVDFARNQTLPLATLDYTYNINATGFTRDDSFDMLFSSDFTDHFVGLQMVVPIGNEAARSRLRQATYRHRQRLATRENREELIRLEVLNAADQVEANWQRILAARQNTLLNARLYEAEQRQFEIGMSTSTDVLDAQIDFANAQSAEIVALAEYQISLVDLAYATGTILGSARIHWEPIVPASDVD